MLLRALQATSVALALGACTATTRYDAAGFPIYTEIKPFHGLSFALDPNHGADGLRIQALLGLALDQWNLGLGHTALGVSADHQLADVKILYTPTVGLMDHPAHTELLGCQSGLGQLTECRIRLELPLALTTAEAMAPVGYLFGSGPLDQALTARRDYQDPGEYLRDKLILLSLMHEIGHTMGLAHAMDPSCVMASSPKGRFGLCPSELEAAQRRIVKD